MDGYFDEMLRRLRLTKNQQNDARVKYTSVSKTLHDAFYDTEYTGDSKLLIGSYGKKTNIRPPEDVDLLFKIPVEIYEQYLIHTGNGPAALLQKVREILGKKFITTDKISAWGKVVLIEFSDGTHNIELLPGYEIDGIFIIPNSEDGGSWDSFDVRADLNLVSASHNRTNGRTRPLIKYIKRWRKRHSSMTMKSYEIEGYCVKFLDTYEHIGKSWSEVVAEFFNWLSTHADKDVSFIDNAKSRAIKAQAYERSDKITEACDEWQKIFGNVFPVYSRSLDRIYALSKQYPSASEQYIEDLYPVRPNQAHNVRISSTVTGKGFMPRSISEFLSKYLGLPKNMSLEFRALSNVPGNVEYWWKVRNFGSEAKAVGIGKGLRGEITQSLSNLKKESTLYHGTHYVECYVIKDGVCVAKAIQFVPITNEGAEE